MRTPTEKTIIFTFLSRRTRDMKMRWKATMRFTPEATRETEIELQIEDGEGVAVKEGMFELHGQRVPVRDGKARMEYGSFIKGIEEKGVWLYRPKCVPVPGVLTFV